VRKKNEVSRRKKTVEDEKKEVPRRLIVGENCGEKNGGSEGK